MGNDLPGFARKPYQLCPTPERISRKWPIENATDSVPRSEVRCIHGAKLWGDTRFTHTMAARLTKSYPSSRKKSKGTNSTKLTWSSAALAALRVLAALSATSRSRASIASASCTRIRACSFWTLASTPSTRLGESYRARVSLTCRAKEKRVGQGRVWWKVRKGVAACHWYTRAATGSSELKNNSDDEKPWWFHIRWACSIRSVEILHPVLWLPVRKRIMRAQARPWTTPMPAIWLTSTLHGERG